DTERGEEVACRAGRVRVAGAVLGAAGERRAGAVALVAAAVGHGLVAALLGAQPRVDGRVVVADGAGAVGVDLDRAPVAALHGPGPALADRLALEAVRGRAVGDRARRVDGGRVVAECLGAAGLVGEPGGGEDRPVPGDHDVGVPRAGHAVLGRSACALLGRAAGAAVGRAVRHRTLVGRVRAAARAVRGRRGGADTREVAAGPYDQRRRGAREPRAAPPSAGPPRGELVALVRRHDGAFVVGR